MNHQTTMFHKLLITTLSYYTTENVSLLFVVLGLLSRFSPGDDPIAYLNKAMAFLTAIASLRFPLTNNKLRTSSNPRNQATIQDGRVIVQQVQGRQGQGYSSTGYKSNATSSGGNNASGQARVVKCYNCQGEGHMARQCTQPKRPRNAAWYKEKAMLAEAQEAGQILDEEQLAFLADPGVPDGQANAKAVLMANISIYGSDVISEVPHSETYLNDMENQSVHAMQDFEQTLAVDFTDNEIHSDSNIILYSQYLQETQQENVQDTNLQSSVDKECLEIAKKELILENESTLPKNSYFFENNDLKAQLQDKDTTICKLKEIIKSMREKSKEENVNYDYCEIETKNVELENRKEIVDIVAQTPSAYTIVPGMFKLDLEPLAPRLLQNREAHIDYLKYTQEQADILRGTVESSTTSNSNTPMLSPAGLKCSTSNYESELIGTDKSKITRKQSKASKPGHENQKSSKRSQRSKALANFLLQGPILHFLKVIYNLKERKER
ncbi:putative ribonuclease H-like domain-containing protein [Tanacetum coccineum]